MRRWPLIDIGLKAAEYLPFDPKTPPEDIWRDTMEFINDSRKLLRDQVDSAALPMELEFQAGELLDVGANE